MAAGNYEIEVIEPKRLGIIGSLKKEFLSPCSSPKRLARSAASFFPIIQWLPKYSLRDNLLLDMITGLSVGVIHIPMSIAFALLAGVKPIVGLYMSCLASFFYIFFGTSRHASMGSFAVTALMAGVANEKIMENYYGTSKATEIFGLEDYSHLAINPITIVSTMGFTIGIFELAMALMRLDFLCVYFSDALVGGFMTGAVVHILISQLADVLGVTLSRSSGPGYLFVICYKLVEKLPEANPWTVGTSLVAGAFLIFGKDYVTPTINRLSPVKVTIPYELIVIVISTFISNFFAWHESFGVPIVGPVPRGLPRPQLPQFEIIPDCLIPSLEITIVTIAVHIAMVKLIAKNKQYPIDPLQEIYAVGITSTLSGFFPVFPCANALATTMVTVEGGAKTLLSNVATCGLLLSVILWIGPMFEALPLCILATVIIVSLRAMFKKFGELPELWRISRFDCVIWIVSFTSTVCIDVMGGLGVSIAFALLTVIFKTQWPTWNAKIIKPSTSKVHTVIFKFDSVLIFTNVEKFKKAVHEALGNWMYQPMGLESDYKTRLNFVFDCSALTQIDSMGVAALKDLKSEIESKTKVLIYFTNARDDLIDLLLYSQVAESRDDFFNSNDEFLKIMTGSVFII